MCNCNRDCFDQIVQTFLNTYNFRLPQGEDLYSCYASNTILTQRRSNHFDGQCKRIQYYYICFPRGSRQPLTVAILFSGQRVS